MVLAKALFDRIPVNVKLNPVLLKRLVGNSKSIKLEDLRDYDEQIFNSLQYLATTEDLDFEALDMKYSIQDDDGLEIALIENGLEIELTKDNIDDYCLSVAKYYLVTSVREEVK